MKKQVILILFFLVTIISFSQEKLKKQTRITFNFISIGVDYEFPVNDKFLIDFGFGIGAGNSIRKTILNTNKFSPSITTFIPLRLKSAIKYIYNRKKRFQKEKNNTNNSGNYLSFQLLYTTSQKERNFIKPSSPNNALLTEIFWGMQRSLGGNWLFDIHFGLGYAKDFDTKLDKIYPALGLEFSYVIF